MMLKIMNVIYRELNYMKLGNMILYITSCLTIYINKYIKYKYRPSMQYTMPEQLTNRSTTDHHLRNY